MAEPTRIVPYAQQLRSNLNSALDASKARLAAAQNAITAESSKLEAATSAFVSLEVAIAGIRRQLSAIPTPADGDLLLAQLEQAIIDARAKQGEIVTAQTALQEAQAAAASAESDVAAVSAQLAAAEALIKEAEPASARRDELIAALDGRLKDVKADAAKALDEAKTTSATFRKARKRLQDELPAPLLDRALNRRAIAATHIANGLAAREGAETAAARERERIGGLVAAAAGSWAALLRAEGAAKEFVASAKHRFDQANAKLANVADLTVASLTAEQSARLNAQDPLKSDREDAADEAQEVANKRQDLEDKQKELDDAIVQAKAEPNNTGKQTAVTTASGKVDTARQRMTEAEAAFEATSAALMDDWEAAVPDTTWRLLNDYADSLDTLRTMSDPAALSTALKEAEKAYVQAQLLADSSANVLVDLTIEQARRAAREESERQNSAASLFSALRGDN